MRRPIILLVVFLLMIGAALTLSFYTSSIGWIVGLLFGLAGGVAAHILVICVRQPKPALTKQLLTILIEMGDALQETSPSALQRRGGWNQKLFDDVLAHVEQLAPRFQHTLITYLAQPFPLDTGCITALLAVDRLSAAYTYWTRLFPPRQPDESMFVLSLLHDLSEKVEHAISLLEKNTTLL